VPNSSPVTLSSGIYSWVASYSGDALNKPSKSSIGSEIGIVAPSPTSLSTTLSGGGQSGTSITVPEKTTVIDMATLSGTNAASATGKLTYIVYPDSDCDESPVATNTVTVTAGNIPPSNPVTLSRSGTYSWVASYSGDPNNASSQSSCGSETATVQGRSSSYVKTKLVGKGTSEDGILTVSAGTPVSDSATLGGDNASSAGGTLTYTVYELATCEHGSGWWGSSDSSCSPTVVSTDTVTVTNGNVPNSSPVTLSSGIYSWVASYSGDALNKPSKSSIGSEIEIVSKHHPSLGSRT
jgi:hypothetical protein